MSRKWIAGLVALAAVGGTAFAAASALSTGEGPRPAYATVNVDLSDAQPTAARAKGGIGHSSGPQLVYLESSTPTTINPADPAGGGIGPYIDVRLKGCSKVISGGVVPQSTDVFVQGSYVESPSKFHVLIGLDDAAVAVSPRAPFQIDTNLTCLKGVK